MNYLYENVAYLRGLAEGLEVDDTKTGKLLNAIIDVLDDMSEAINALNEDIDNLDEYVDVIDEDLSDLEGSFYDEDITDAYYDLICPECGELFYVDDPTLFDPVYGENKVTCPLCDAKIDLAEYDYCEAYDDMYDYDGTLEEQQNNLTDRPHKETTVDELAKY